MYPYVFDLLPSYGLLFAAGALLAWWWFTHRGKTLGVPEAELFNLCFYTLLAGILGAKAMLLALDWRYYLGQPREILGPFPIPGLLIGAALAVILALGRSPRSPGTGAARTGRVLAYAVVGGAIGAKLWLLVLEPETYATNPEALLGSLLRSAGVLVGGVLIGAVAFVVYARRQGMPLLALGDAIAAPLVAAQAVGRLGCFAAGCCYGKHTHADNPLAVVFTDPAASANTGVPLNVPLIATQPIQMAADLLMVGVLTWMWRRRIGPPGTVFWFYILLYSIARGTIEFWRGDDQRGLFFGDVVSTSQVFAVLGILFAVAMLARGRGRAGETASA